MVNRCKLPGCDKVLARRGSGRFLYCCNHHSFLSKVSIPTEGGCWLWTGKTNNKGYGQLWMNMSYHLAHRFSYSHYRGQIPDGMCVLHSCDNPRCVNPSHLFPGTKRDNTRDMMKKGRQVFQQQPQKLPRGERHGCCKCSDEDVRKIRALYATGNRSHRDLGRQFGISSTQVRNIVKHRQRSVEEMSRTL